jgi:glycosyltransferase involved in cell wall biosynthesis
MKACFFTTSSYDQVLREQYTFADIRILKDLGFDVIFANRLYDIPLHCDLYYSWWASGSIYPLIVAKFSGKPNIVVAGGNEAIPYVDSLTFQKHGYLANGFLKRLATQITLRSSSAVIAVSNFMVKGLTAVGCKKPHVIHNCVDTSLFSPDFSVDREFITTSLRLDFGPSIIKRTENFIRAAALLKQGDSDLKFLVIGHKGEAFSKLNLLCHSLGLSGSILFTGSIENSEVVKYLRRSICFVQPSDTETFGVAVAEAMSIGCPVVLSRCGALPELASSLAVYVDHNSPESIANGIGEVLKMTLSERQLIGTQSRHRIVNEFSYSKRKDAISHLIFDKVFKGL